MSVSGFENSIEVAGSQTATSSSTSLGASTASYAGSSQHYQPQPSAAHASAGLQQAYAHAAGSTLGQQQQQPQQNQERHPSLLHNVSSASGASAQPGYHSSQNQTQALLQHNTSSSSHSSKRANRRSSSARSNSNNEATTSSHSAPGSPKIEVASASKRVTTAAAGGQQGIPSSGSSNTVLSHSYFHTLPEEAAVLFELKSSHQDPNQAPYQQLQHGSNQRMSMDMLQRQGSNESTNEYESRMANSGQMLINHNTINGSSVANSAGGGALLAGGAPPAPFPPDFSTGGNISSNINGNSANNTQNSSSSTIYHLLPSTQPIYTAATSAQATVVAHTAATNSSNSAAQTANVGSQSGGSQSGISCGGISGGKIQLDNAISPAVVAAVAAAGYDSDSDIEQQQQTTAASATSGSRSRQKKFIKNFKQLPQEEVVLQRYSCALVSDILLQGHLYITENYFAFHSNVFGYVTRLQIPVRSVTKITKEKTAKIIPNAVGVCTEDDVKHIFASLLSRDTTFKLMTRLWKRAIREAGRITEEDLMLPDTCDVPEVDELDGIINEDESSDSEGFVQDGGGRKSSHNRIESRIPTVVSEVTGPIIVKRMNTSNGTVYYQQPAAATNSSAASANCRDPSRNPASSDSISSQNDIQTRRRSSILSNGGGILSHLSRSTILSIFVVVLLIFLFCSSMYLVFRVDSLQRQVESRYFYKIPGDWPRMGQNEESPEKIHKVLDDNVEQISTVRKSLEKLSTLIQTEETPSPSPYSTKDEI